MAKAKAKSTTGKMAMRKVVSKKTAVKKPKPVSRRSPSEDRTGGRKVRPMETDVIVQSGQMGQTSDQSTELNLSPSDIREAGFGEFIDDEWRMDEDVKEDLVRPRDSNVDMRKTVRRKKR